MSNSNTTLRNVGFAVVLIALLGVMLAITVIPFDSPSAQTAVSTEVMGGCTGSGQAVTTESSNGSLGCGTFLTTQTSVFFSYGSCPNLENQFVVAITTTTLNCSAHLGSKFDTQTPFYIVSTLTGAFKQVGLAIYFTPNSTEIFVNGEVDLQTNRTACGAYTQLDYGTGTAPVQGVSQTGTLVGSALNFFPPFANIGQNIPVADLITGLISGTQYWVDFALTSTPGNGCFLGNAEFVGESLVLIQV